MQGASSWGCGAWPLNAGEFLEVVQTRGLLCHHDLTLASASCRCWRSIFRPLFFPGGENGWRFPCRHRDCREFEDRNPLECACRRGSVSLVCLLTSPDLKWNPALFPRVVECAAESGSVECVSRVVELGACWTTWTGSYAAMSGNVELARLVRKSGCRFGVSDCAEPRLEMVRYLHEECGCSLNYLFYKNAVLSGNLECLRYGREKGRLRDPEALEALEEIGEIAGTSGRLDVLQYLKEDGVPWTETICASIASGGHLELLRRFHEEFGVPWDHQTPSRAARGGHLDCLLYSRQKGCPWDADSMCLSAAEGGSVECLRYCVDQGCAHSYPEICLEACRCSVELLRVAHEGGCPWHPHCLPTAIHGGQLDVVKYLHENGCPWDAKMLVEGDCHLTELRYLHESGCPWDENVCVVFARSLSSSSCLSYARCHGCPWSQEVMGSAAKAWSVVCLKYGHEHGLSLTPEILGLLINDRVGVLKYGRSVGWSWDSGTMKSALDCGSVMCFRYCLDNGCPCDYGTISIHPNFERWVKEGRIPSTAPFCSS